MKNCDVVCIGNAVIDFYKVIDDRKLKEMNLSPASMNIIDKDASDRLYRILTFDNVLSGGSAANTAIGIASLGGKVRFIGKVNDDLLGNLYRDYMIKQNIDFIINPYHGDLKTGKSYILISRNNAERTMCTYLGASSSLNIDDIANGQIIDSKILFIEGYLWDNPNPKKAAMRAIDIAKKNNVRVAFSLSDKSCIARHNDDFQDLIKQVDVLFGNEKEAFEIFQTDNLEHVIKLAQERCKIAVFTLGSKGSVIITPESIYRLEIEKSSNIIDTTGAGDLYAAGILYGLSQNMDIKECARLANIASLENITHIGTRPHENLKNLL